MYKFGQIKIASKEFSSEYKVTENVDLEKIRISEGVVASKHDCRFIIGYLKDRKFRKQKVSRDRKFANFLTKI